MARRAACNEADSSPNKRAWPGLKPSSFSCHYLRGFPLSPGLKPAFSGLQTRICLCRRRSCRNSSQLSSMDILVLTGMHSNCLDSYSSHLHSLFSCSLSRLSRYQKRAMSSLHLPGPALRLRESFFVRHGEIHGWAGILHGSGIQWWSSLFFLPLVSSIGCLRYGARVAWTRCCTMGRREMVLIRWSSFWSKGERPQCVGSSGLISCFSFHCLHVVK
jgi:hypothetical protein